MTKQAIEKLFKTVVSDRKFGSANGYTKQAVYNYRHRECSIGQKLEVLFNAGSIKIEETHEPISK